jgi:hypothetical protein
MEGTRWRGGAAAAIGVALGLACGSASTFSCADDGDCSGGVCAAGYCAFPDDTCDSHLRYGDHGGALAGLCVLPADETATSGETTTSGEMTSGPEPTTGPTVDDSTGADPTGSFEFLDDEAAEFSAGSMDGVVYADGHLRLIDAGTTGTFTSRVFDAGVIAQWEDLRWMPDAPYAKPLPNAQAAETGYEFGAVDMSGNVWLAHFEEPGPLAAGTAIADGSGMGNAAQIVGSDASTAVPGVFGLALEDAVDAYVSIDTASGSFDFGVDDFTWSIWFRFTHDCATNNVWMGIEDVVGGGDLEEHLWMGCSSSVWTDCPPVDPGPHAAGTLISQQGADPEDGLPVCGEPGIDDGQWHHMLLTKEGHARSVVRFYVDAQLQSETTGSFAQPIVFDNDPDFAIGAFTGETYDSSATLDESVIWRRALTNDEIRGVYERGASQLALEIRVCEDATCADDPPFRGGEDLVASEVFVDPSDALSPGTPLSVSGLPPGRYVQYRVTMHAAEASRPPALSSVRVGGAML